MASSHRRRRRRCRRCLGRRPGRVGWPDLGLPEGSFRGVPKSPESAPGLPEARKFTFMKGFLHEIAWISEPARNREIRLLGPARFRLRSGGPTFRLLLYVCGETAYLVFWNAVCVYVSSGLFSGPNCMFSYINSRWLVGSATLIFRYQDVGLAFVLFDVMFGSSLALLLRSSWCPEVELGIVMYRRRQGIASCLSRFGFRCDHLKGMQRIHDLE